MKKEILLLVFVLAFVGLVKADEFRIIDSSTKKIGYRKTSIKKDVDGIDRNMHQGEEQIYDQKTVDGERARVIKRLKRAATRMESAQVAHDRDIEKLDAIQAEMDK